MVPCLISTQAETQQLQKRLGCGRFPVCGHDNAHGSKQHVKLLYVQSVHELLPVNA